jgi:hypothetical protein
MTASLPALLATGFVLGWSVAWPPGPISGSHQIWGKAGAAAPALHSMQGSAPLKKEACWATFDPADPVSARLILDAGRAI